MRFHTITSGAVALAIAGSGAALVAQDKTADVLGAARKAIGKKVDTLKTFSIQATVQRNVGPMQMTSDVELLLELPDKYLRSDVMSGPVSGGTTSGFNGNKPLQRANMAGMGGGQMVIRMAGPGGTSFSTNGTEKLSPEDQERVNQSMLRTSRQEISRLMLGWFAMAHPSINATYAYAGEAESPDGKADVIDVKNADGFAARLFIDQATQLPLMITYQAPQPRMLTAGAPGSTMVRREGAQPMTDEERKKVREEAEKQLQDMQKQPPVMADYTLYFDQWLEVEGVKFPHRIRRAMAGATTEEWTVTKVKVNPKIDPKKFTIES
jgi:hypothetical protein